MALNTNSDTLTDWDAIKDRLAEPYPDDEYLQDQKNVYESAEKYANSMRQVSDVTLQERFDI